jgi:hypothetical protein
MKSCNRKNISNKKKLGFSSRRAWEAGCTFINGFIEAEDT